MQFSPPIACSPIPPLTVLHTDASNHVAKALQGPDYAVVNLSRETGLIIAEKDVARELTWATTPENIRKVHRLGISILKGPAKPRSSIRVMPVSLWQVGSRTHSRHTSPNDEAVAGAERVVRLFGADRIVRHITVYVPQGVPNARMPVTASGSLWSWG